MGWFILGISLLAALLLAGKWFVTADPRQLAQALRYGGAGCVGLVVVFLMVTGRFALGLPLAMLAFALLRRWSVPRFQFHSNGSRSTRGRTSEVQTDYLRM